MKRLSPDEQRQVLDRVPELLEALEQRLQVAVPFGRPHYELWPLLGAARCVRMVRGMLALDSAGMKDIIGVIARAHYETWAAAMYVCHGGQTAVDELAADFRHYFDRILKYLQIELPEQTPQVLRDAAQNVLPTLALVTRLEAALPEKHPLKNYPKVAYQHLFRGESLFSSHGRVGSIMKHQEGSEDGIAIRVTGKETPEQLDRVWEAAALTGCLAMDALRKTGQETKDLEELVDTIGLPAYPER